MKSTSHGVETARQELLGLLREHALTVGRVVLSSGSETDYYIDAKKALLTPAAFRACGILVADIAKLVCRQTRLPFKPIMKPPRPNDVARHYADISKARKLLSYKPEIAINEGVKKYISWVKHTYPNPKKLLKKIPDRNW